MTKWIDVVKKHVAEARKQGKKANLREILPKARVEWNSIKAKLGLPTTVTKKVSKVKKASKKAAKASKKAVKKVAKNVSKKVAKASKKASKKMKRGKRGKRGKRASKKGGSCGGTPLL